MEKDTSNIKWAIIGQIVGVILDFIAFYAPLDSGMKTTLFIVGAVLIVGYDAILYRTYKSLSDSNKQ